jgi:hypothetical protein
VRRRMKIGNRYNMLTVVRLLPNKKAECQCECGNIRVINRQSITSGNTKSCGCLLALCGPKISAKRTRLLTTSRFGQLTVLHQERVGPVYRFRCRCDCGNEVLVAGYELRGGRISCGCRNGKSGRGTPKHSVSVGNIFGELTVVAVGPGANVRLVCSCGTHITIPSWRLHHGRKVCTKKHVNSRVGGSDSGKRRTWEHKGLDWNAKFFVDGKRLSLQRFCDTFGLPERSTRRRLGEGITRDELLRLARTTVDVMGVRLRLSDAAAVAGMSIWQLWKRIDAGEPPAGPLFS